jgi:hypothetical protein
MFRDRSEDGGRKPEDGKGKAGENFPELKQVMEIGGPWQVMFDPKWLGAEDGGRKTEDGTYSFETLQDWSMRNETEIKYYSGKAVYRKTFDLPASVLRPPAAVYLDLGVVKEIASVRLNGKQLGTVWCAPWRVEITEAVRPGGNQLEIDVVNLWQNRLVGDAALPQDKRVTRTNIASKKNQPLLASGLLGPVRLLKTEGSGAE